MFIYSLYTVDISAAVTHSPVRAVTFNNKRTTNIKIKQNFKGLKGTGGCLKAELSLNCAKTNDSDVGGLL